MRKALARNVKFARENRGGTWVGQHMLGAEANEHIICSNMYLVAVERLIELEDELKAHQADLIAMVRLAAGTGQAPRTFEIALDKLLAVGQMAIGLLEEYHK